SVSALPLMVASCAVRAFSRRAVAVKSAVDRRRLRLADGSEASARANYTGRRFDTVVLRLHSVNFPRTRASYNSPQCARRVFQRVGATPFLIGQRALIRECGAQFADRVFRFNAAHARVVEMHRGSFQADGKSRLVRS